ncbi:MAG TPA: sugar phosphate isomerase/epimerase family protein [Blastocatellia bacterium]|nr:sugar phosphate isomerase/epimerase family protein [Blastocatellia bacterium]
MKLRAPLAALCLLSLCSLSASGGKTLNVKVGYVTPLSEIDAAKAAGFDYLELRTAEVAGLPDADYEKLVEKIKHLGIPAPVSNNFIPASIKLTGPAIDKDQQMNYVRKAFDRVSKLGVQIIVFGSGDARRVPEGFSKEEAFRQLVEFCRRIAPEARARKITIAIEPLRRQESNIINTAGEGLELVKAVNDPDIQLMVDFYHLAFEKEDPAIIIRAKDHIRHLHMANPEGRVFPLKWEEYNYAPFFENLRRIGYDKRISVEAKAVDFTKDAPQAIALLRKAFTQ